MAGATFSRQTLSIGAGCLNWASPDLCGGRLERDVPTAIDIRCAPRSRSSSCNSVARDNTVIDSLRERLLDTERNIHIINGNGCCEQ
jgi:hypothetical protein